MSELIDATFNILSQNTICFETRLINTEYIPNPIQDAKFGILNFKAVTSNETNDELDFLFTIDCSGSMADICSDKRSKMTHIIHTLKNMIIFFLEHPNIKINITVNAFDTRTYKIVKRCKITNENIKEIICNIEKVIPRGSTNIQTALDESFTIITDLRDRYPNNIITHIFMTDGEVTDGSNNINLLKSIVVEDITNIFIGFGVDHDATLLNGISSVKKGAYYFIDKLENAGLVYGEVLHGIVYKLANDAEVIIDNGLIYNFKTNIWEQTLKIGDIASESVKTFNIISTNPHDCKVYIKAIIEEKEVFMSSTLVEISSEDLTSHVYRQRTLQLLYEVNEFCNQKRRYSNDTLLQIYNTRLCDYENTDSEERSILKTKMHNLFEEIKKYIIDNNLEHDKLLKNLCDDIYICYRTFGTKYGKMFCASRQTTQGTQRIYSAYDTTVIEQEPIHRMNATNMMHNVSSEYDDDIYINSDDDLTMLEHFVSDLSGAPYASLQATQLMREISSNIEHIGDEYNSDNETLY